MGFEPLCHIYMQINTDTYIHILTYIQCHIHTYTQCQIHTYIQSYTYQPYIDNSQLNSGSWLQELLLEKMSRSTELSRLLGEARLEGYRENLENNLKVSSVAQLRQLRNYSDLARIGMKKDEIERLRSVLKGNTMSKLRRVITTIIVTIIIIK